VPELRESSRATLENVGLKGVGAALSEDGRWLAGISTTPDADGAIHLWDTRTGRHTVTLRGHTGRILGLRFSADHRWLASGSFDKTARLWDLTTFRETAVLRGADNGVTTLSFAPDGRTLAAGSWDGVARLWRVPSGQLIGELPHYDNVPVPEFLPDGRTLSVMTMSTGIRLFNLDTQRDTCILRWPGGRPYRYVRCSPDGQMIAVYSQDGRIKLWPAPKSE
jgi:WD40 repeat protein